MPADRPVILTFTRHYLPGYKAGGPIRSIANMVEALGDEFDFRIVTSDRDATDEMPYPHLGEGSEWKPVGKARALYLSPSQKGFLRIAGILRRTPHDILYLNSFFDPAFTIQPLLARRLGLAPETRCVLAPRGEFSQGALDLKAWKKRLFLFAAHSVDLYRGVTWQASSVHEEADIRWVMKANSAKVHVAMDMPATSSRKNSDRYRPRADGEPLRVCFLSRISPMKNLHFALEVLARVTVPVTFFIYGPKDEVYWATHCEPAIAALPPHVSVTYGGVVDHTKVLDVLSGYDLFFLPTLGENYGHVIAEALCAGLPLLLSDQTLWRDLARDGVGADLPLSRPDQFVYFIENFFRLSEQTRTEIRDRVTRRASRLGDTVSKIEAHRMLFEMGRRGDDATDG